MKGNSNFSRREVKLWRMSDRPPRSGPPEIRRRP